jgi:hypothetical protein
LQNPIARQRRKRREHSKVIPFQKTVGVSATVEDMTAPGTPMAPALMNRKTAPIERLGEPPSELIPKLRVRPKIPRTSALSIRGSILFIALSLPEMFIFPSPFSEVRTENPSKNGSSG